MEQQQQQLDLEQQRVERQSLTNGGVGGDDDIDEQAPPIVKPILGDDDMDGRDTQIEKPSSSICGPKRVCVITIVVIVVALILALALFFTIGQPNCDSAQNRKFVEQNPFPDQCGRRDPDLGKAIIGGSAAEPGRYPWQVDLQTCGGTIVDSLHVITAAHCVCYSDSSRSRGDIVGKKIAVGNNFPLRKPKKECGKQMRKIKSFVVHENFCGKYKGCVENGARQKAFENDIAILTVDEPFRFNSFVQPACLPKRDYPHKQGSEVFVSGFGVSDHNKYPKRLMGVDLPLIETQNCKFTGKALPENMVCAGKEEGGFDSCQGDSGGPMVQFDEQDTATLVGVVSWGYGCAKPGKPGVYAKVAYFHDWIKGKLN